jgi:hypothetical protein
MSKLWFGYLVPEFFITRLHICPSRGKQLVPRNYFTPYAHLIFAPSHPKPVRTTGLDAVPLDNTKIPNPL